MVTKNKKSYQLVRDLASCGKNDRLVAKIKEEAYSEEKGKKTLPIYVELAYLGVPHTHKLPPI